MSFPSLWYGFDSRYLLHKHKKHAMTYRVRIFLEAIIAILLSCANFLLMQIFCYRYSLSFILYFILKIRNVNVSPYCIFTLGICDDIMMSSCIGFHATEYSICDFLLSNTKIMLVNKNVVCYVIICAMICLSF